MRLKIASDCLQMRSADRFHLYLHLPDARIHIVKQLLSGSPQILLQLIVQKFPYVQRGADSTHPKPQIIHRCKLIFSVHLLHNILENGCPIQLHAAKIKIIPQRAILPVNNRGRLHISVLVHKTIGINHRRTRIPGHGNHPFQAEIHPPQLSLSGVQQQIFRITRASYLTKTFRRSTGAYIKSLYHFHNSANLNKKY